MGNARAFVFDAFGTLFDVHSAAETIRDRLGNRAGELSALWRGKQLEYTWLRSLMGRHADFAQVTAEALDYALAACGIEDPSLLETLPSAYLRLAPYPEARATLEALRRRGRRTAILSNGTPGMLSSLVEHAELGPLLDEVLSVEEVGVFKPDARVYRLACDRLALAPREILFLSSNAWDVAGAASFGMTVVWVNRSGAVRERLPGAPAAEVRSLDALLDLAELGED